MYLLSGFITVHCNHHLLGTVGIWLFPVQHRPAKWSIGPACQKLTTSCVCSQSTKVCNLGTLLTLKDFGSVLPISHGIIRLLYFQVLHMMSSALHARSAKQCQRSVEQGIWWCSQPFKCNCKYLQLRVRHRNREAVWHIHFVVQWNPLTHRLNVRKSTQRTFNSVDSMKPFLGTNDVYVYNSPGKDPNVTKDGTALSLVLVTSCGTLSRLSRIRAPGLTV